MAVALLTNHNLAHQVVTNEANASGRQRGPKLDRPKVDVGIDSESWNMFVRRWETFAVGSDLDDASAPIQLLHCAGETLSEALLKADPAIATRSTTEVLAAMESFAVIRVSRGVKRAELFSMHQDSDEKFRHFAARVRGKAETCGFSLRVACPCGQVNIISYTDETIRDVLLSGIADLDIRREALGIESDKLSTVNEVIAFVEGREIARAALPLTHNAALSTFKRNIVRDATDSSALALPQADRQQRGRCPDCKALFPLFVETPRGWNKKAHERCKDCFLARRRRQRRSSPPLATNNANTVHTKYVSQNSSIATRNPASLSHPEISIVHHIFKSGRWQRGAFTRHPTVRLTLSIDISAPRSSQQFLPRRRSSVEINAVTDSGAQSDVWSLDQFLAQGFQKSDLQPSSLELEAANRTQIRISGVFFCGSGRQYTPRYDEILPHYGVCQQ